jgi:hypothetical protein
MKIRRFVSGSSLLLVGWLAATFLSAEPAQRYPALGRSAQASVQPKPESAPALAVQEKTDERSVSASR